MHFFHFKETNLTRNYDIVATGFSSAQISPIEALRPKSKWDVEFIKDVTALFSSIILSSIGYGILAVLIAFKVEEYIKNEILISFSSASQIAAGVVVARFLPSLGRKIGMVNSLYLASFVSAICALLMYFYISYLLWILTIFIFGIALFICGVTRQTLMIDIAPVHMKAMMISLGSMLVAIGNSFGPIFLDLIKTSNSFTSFSVAACAYILSMLPLSRLKKTEIEVREEKKIGIWRYIQTSPKIMFAGFCVNYAMSSANAFLIIYGIKIGMSHSDSALLYSVLLFGTIFSIPLGYLTDIINRRFLMIFSAFLALMCIISLIYNTNPQKTYLLLFLTFGCMTGMKLPAIVLINEKYKPTQRLAVNAAFAKFSLIGNIFGIFCTGAIMNSYGPNGLWASLAIILNFYLIFCLFNYFKKFLKGELNFDKFSLSNDSRMEN